MGKCCGDSTVFAQKETRAGISSMGIKLAIN